DVGASDALATTGGRISLPLPPRSGRVYALPRPRELAPEAEPGKHLITLEPLAQPAVEGDFEVTGHAKAGTALQLVVDGDLVHSAPLTVGTDGVFSARIDTSALNDPSISHRLVAWSANTGDASEPAMFKVTPRWTLAAQSEDPAGDDTGPDGRYVYPTDPSWAMRPLD